MSLPKAHGVIVSLTVGLSGGCDAIQVPPQQLLPPERTLELLLVPPQQVSGAK